MLTLLSWLFVLLGIGTAISIALDVRRCPQPMAIMNLTWPITGLYMPVIGWWAYRQMGRTSRSAPQHQGHASHGDEAPDQASHDDAHAHRGHADQARSPQADSHQAHHGEAHAHHHGTDKPKWQGVFVSATHCGGGCTLGDVVTAPLATATGFALFGSTTAGHFLLAFIGAYLFGVLFQYLPIRAMSGAGPLQAFKDAIKADTLSLIAFQIGMYVWMLIALNAWLGEMNAFNIHFWFMMQIAMLIGFATSYPANWLLIDRGIKHAM
ncbi:DUF4396 domain-containing protein [Salinicola avicenniae]|uniref:DUF4396 domain-containing protein n=1 Tax=Salinicola avicenniae TaxID=2916836 RepID=UPI002072CE84|nr:MULTISPECIES: DUF4396 domain-containing protein [unclassified Salinicola]